MRSTCNESCHIYILECPLGLWSQPWPQSTDVLMEARVAAHLQRHLLPTPSPGQPRAGLMRSPGACCFHVSGVADPLCSLHPWDPRFLSCLAPFWILIGVWGLWRLGERPPRHLLELVLCLNSLNGGTKVLAGSAGGWPETPLPLTLRLKSQDLTVTFKRSFYCNTFHRDSTGNGLIYLRILEMCPALPWQWLLLNPPRGDLPRGCIKSCWLHLKHRGRGCCCGISK